MGLTIHYTLKAQRSEARARELIDALHQHAQDLPFKALGPVAHLSGSECDFNQRDRKDPMRWLLVQAVETLEVKLKQLGQGHRSVLPVTVIPEQVIAFTAWPGEGCEESNFGLCRYPAVVPTEAGPHKTKLAGWRWSSFCKTQYGSDPKLGGWPNFLQCHLTVIAIGSPRTTRQFTTTNFLQCHLTVIAMLDKAKQLGCLEKVDDESQFWEKRDLEALAKEINSWNEMMAAWGGCLKDLAGDHSGGIEMAISRFDNFEKLEAEGQKHMTPELLKLVKLARKVMP